MIRRTRLVPILGVFLFSASLSPFAVAAPLWSDLEERSSARSEAVAGYRALKADLPMLEHRLAVAPREFSGQEAARLELPLPDGSLVEVGVVESPVLSKEQSGKHPEIRTYKIYQIANPAFTGRMDITPTGFHAMLRTADGLVFINPETRYNRGAEGSHYRSFRKDSQQRTEPFSCQTRSRTDSLLNESVTDPLHMLRPSVERNFGNQLRTYRLALSATLQYSIAVADGNRNNTLAEMVTAINRVNEIYEKDVAVRLQLVSGIELISTSTGDFSNSDGVALLEQNQEWIDTITGSNNYDIGHIFSTGGGGIASIASVCDGDGDGNEDYKAQGVTGSANPVNDAFYVDYVAHEIGHQFGASHTFNADGNLAGSCKDNRSDKYSFGTVTYLAASAYEPGSGSTIMAYAGICEAQDLQNHSDAYFHARSIEQVREFLSGEIAAAEQDDLPWADGSRCGTSTATGDLVPAANAGADRTIPANTPFVLTGSATDGDSSTTTFLYTWEQYDLGNATTTVTQMHTDLGAGPLIRSRTGTNSPQRYIPTLDAILAGDFAANIGERLPTKDRTMQFRLTLRSGSYGVSQDSMTVTVDKDSGPFKVTAPLNKEALGTGKTITVTWNVARTNASPVNCNSVDISFSSNGGQTFPVSLKAGTPNDGTEPVVFPNILTTQGRIKVACSNNIFFNVSPDNLTVTADGGDGGSTGGSTKKSSGGGGFVSFGMLLLMLGLLPMRGVGRLIRRQARQC